MDAAGDGGLLGLAVSPTYPEDGLLYAYLSTAVDNRVVRFPVGGTPNAVLTGIPRGEVHNGGGLLFGADGSLYVGTGDTGNPALATDPASLAGKVLRIDVFGGPVGAGPGLHQRAPRRDRACAPGEEGRLFAADAARDGADELDELVEGNDYAGPAGPVAEIVAGRGRAGRLRRRWAPPSSSARWTASGCTSSPSTRAGRCPATSRSSSAGSTAGCGPSSPTPRARCGSPRPTATASGRRPRTTTRCCGSTRRPPPDGPAPL